MNPCSVKPYLDRFKPGKAKVKVNGSPTRDIIEGAVSIKHGDVWHKDIWRKAETVSNRRRW